MWRNWNSYILLVRTKNGTAAMENSITVVQKVKYRIAIWSSNFIFRYILKIKRLKEINITQQSPYRIIHNSQKVVTTQMSIKR